MSEVKRFRADHRHVVETEFDDAQFVDVADFGRVTAERDALQALLTAADERADVLEGLLRDARQHHGVQLPTDPPKDAWKYHRMDERISEALTGPVLSGTYQLSGSYQLNDKGDPIVKKVFWSGEWRPASDFNNATLTGHYAKGTPNRDAEAALKPAEGGGDDKRKADFIRINSAPHCPECGHPDCNGQCFGDDMMGD